MQEYGADIPKIAVMPQSVDDLIVLLDATNTMKTKYADRPFITMSMSGTGLVSRLAGAVFGSACTFGAGIEASAPGKSLLINKKCFRNYRSKHVKGDLTITNFEKNLEKIDGRTIGLVELNRFSTITNY